MSDREQVKRDKIKAANGGRVNPVPKITDEDIIALCKAYPKKQAEMVTGGDDQRKEERKEKKAMLNDIIYKIEKFRSKNKNDVRKAVHKQLMQNMREEEYIRVLQMLK
jgi:ribonuclease D